MPRPMLLLVASALVPLLGRASVGQEEPARPPDVLVVLADDMGWPELEGAPTPHLDSLAREGVSLTRFFSMPQCAPSRHALLHGRWPRRSGVGGNINCFQPPSPTNPTPSAGLLSLPKLLRARGYHTALVGKWHLGQAPGGEGDPLRNAPQAHGFEHWLAGSPANLHTGKGRDYDRWLRIDDGVERIETEYATRAQRDAALAWWRDTPSPKFLLVALNAPHEPFHFPPSDMLPAGFRPPDLPRPKLLSLVTSIDQVFGHLHAAVDPARTLVVFLSDNGMVPAPGETADGKGSTGERGIRVPFLASGPGLARGEACAAMVSMVDVLATLAEATGAPLSEERSDGAEDSRSFLGALLHPRDWRPERPWVLAERYDDEVDDFCLRTARWKLRRVDGLERLVDLERDPDELHPLDPSAELDTEARAGLEDLRRILASAVPPRAD